MEENAVIVSNARIAKDVYEMVLESQIARISAPGQFVQVSVPGYFLRRPISICDAKDGKLTLIFKVVGDGTTVMSGLKSGDSVSLFGPLGTGFPVEDHDVLLVGGGVGTPPLVYTARAYRKAGHNVSVVLGFNSADDVFGLDKFIQEGITPVVCTMDGTAGIKGTVIDGIRQRGLDTSHVLACGPIPMLKAVNNFNGYISLEARMACGFGACMGCVVKDVEGNYLRVCKDGPVFKTGRIAL